MSDKTKIVDFSAAAKKRGKQLPSKIPAAVQITGNNNFGVAGDHNNININVKAPERKKARIEIQRGPGDITEAQAAEIQALVAKVVKVSGKPFKTVWSIVQNKFDFASYRLLPQEKFEDVRAYLRQWVASGKGPRMPSRNTILARIHAEANKQSGLNGLIHRHIETIHGVSSLGDLTVAQLNEVIKHFQL